jgi:O-antigen biosynthesis protein
MRHLINILVLTHNCLNSIKKHIEHLYKNTTHSDFKLFILDNGSVDGTVEYLKEVKKLYNNLYINFQESNLGIIKGRNKCYEFSKSIDVISSYIMFLDADQYVKENWLNSYLKLMEEGYDLIGVEAWQMDNRFYPYKRVKNREEEFNYVGAGGLLIKREVFEKLEKFDEDYDFIYFEDPSLCFLAHESNYKVGWNYNKIIIHDHSGPLLSNENRKYFMSNWNKFREKWKGYKIPVFKMK